jgi:hypothetical protein
MRKQGTATGLDAGAAVEDGSKAVSWQNYDNP